MEKMNGLSMDIEQTERDKLQSLFPSCFSEGKLDIDKLLNICGEYLDEDFEKYKFEWKGKAKCFRIAGKRSTCTLRPCEDESMNFDTTQNVYIEGDNLEVLKLLQTSYYRKVKMIYIDPPYNTGNDFEYADDFKDPMTRYKKVTQQATKSNPETMGRFHTNWLNMMYPRLRLAASLLRDDGVIFISIDDGEQANLKKLCDEIFGEENFVTQFIWRKKTGASDAKGIASITEYILVYVKSYNLIAKIFSRNKDSFDPKRYRLTDEFENDRGTYYIDNLDRGGIQYSDSMNYGIECPDGTITFPNGRKQFFNDGWIWTWGKEKVQWGIENKFIEFRSSSTKESGWSVCYKNYMFVNNKGEKNERSAPHKKLILDIINTKATLDIQEMFGSKVFQYTKPVEIIKLLIS